MSRSASQQRLLGSAASSAVTGQCSQQRSYRVQPLDLRGGYWIGHHPLALDELDSLRDGSAVPPAVRSGAGGQSGAGASEYCRPCTERKRWHTVLLQAECRRGQLNGSA